MSRVPMPSTKKEAEKVMNMFSEFAHSLNYLKNFEKAVYLLHGESFIAKSDSNKRMLFSCIACNKEMNSSKSLSDHSGSGSHLKNIDKNWQDRAVNLISPRGGAYRRDSLQSKILNCEVKILGLQLVSAFENDRGNFYYKCWMCGAHGKLDAIYKHLLGDKHTDAYLRARVELPNSHITSKERSYLRELVYKEDGYGVQYIKEIKGDHYYPFKWEDEGLPKSVIDKRNEARLQALAVKESSSSEKSSAADSPANKIPQNKMSTEQKKIFYKDFLENVIIKLNFIVYTHELEESRFKTKKDVIIGFKIMHSVLHLLFYTVRKSLSRATSTQEKEALERQKKVLESCFGYLKICIQPELVKNYGMEPVFKSKDKAQIA